MKNRIGRGDDDLGSCLLLDNHSDTIDDEAVTTDLMGWPQQAQLWSNCHIAGTTPPWTGEEFSFDKAEEKLNDVRSALPGGSHHESGIPVPLQLVRQFRQLDLDAHDPNDNSSTQSGAPVDYSPYV